jgi:hypothetical protein
MSYYGFTIGLIFIGSCTLSMCIYKIIKICNLIEYDSEFDTDTDESNYETEYSSDFNETDIEEDYEENNSIDFQDNTNNLENINNFEIYIIEEKKEEENINYNSRILIF